MPPVRRSCWNSPGPPVASITRQRVAEIVFVAFAAEERGLLGSQQYVRQPPYALENTVAMVNLDMVGRLNDNKLILYGTGTAKEFDPLVNRLNEQYRFDLKKEPGGYGPSDHSTFYAKDIPVLHFFTGSHSDYHRPSDDAEKLNLEGMRRIHDMTWDIVRENGHCGNEAAVRGHARRTDGPRRRSPVLRQHPPIRTGRQRLRVAGGRQRQPRRKSGDPRWRRDCAVGCQ